MTLNKRIENLNIASEELIITPAELKKQYPLTENIVKTVFNGQTTIKKILSREDNRILAVVGPCSIHDVKAAKEYAGRLKRLADELSESLFIVMRVYFEKPRTTTGWQGLIMDPFLDNSCNIDQGLRFSRELLTYVGELGLPAAGEALDIITPPYLQDLFSWSAIGARTAESQSHRKMASGLSAVVGFKNSTNGNVDIAIQALQSVATSQNFVSIEPNGHVAAVSTKGNPYTHIILRGGKTPNYRAENIAIVEDKLRKAGFLPNIMIDCSHANSGKKAAKQAVVLADVAKQITEGNDSIMGIMIESNLNFGKQIIPEDITKLQYGVSVTDQCLDWDTTEEILRHFSARIKNTLKARTGFQKVVS